MKKTDAPTPYSRRVATCLNALKGVPDEWLEQYADGKSIKNIVEQSCDLVRKEEELTEKLIAAEEENAALREALKGETMNWLEDSSLPIGDCPYPEKDKYDRQMVPVELAYLKKLEDHVARADRILQVAGEVYDEFQKKIAHADNGAQLLEALHRLHVELHKERP